MLAQLARLEAARGLDLPVRLRRADRHRLPGREPGIVLPRRPLVGLDDRQRADRPGHRGDADPDGGDVRRAREQRRLDAAAPRRPHTRRKRREARAPAGRLAGVARELVGDARRRRLRAGHGRRGAVPGYLVAGKTGHRGEARPAAAATRTRTTSRRSSGSSRPARRALSSSSRRRAAGSDLRRRRSPPRRSATSPGSRCSTSTCRRTTRVAQGSGTPSAQPPPASPLAATSGVSSSARSARCAVTVSTRALLDSLVVDLERLIAVLAPAEVVGRGGDRDPRPRLRRPRRRAGSLFFCVPGERADGHDFAPEAVANGAVALVVQRPLDLAVPQLVVPDSRAAMAVAADEFFGRPTAELPWRASPARRARRRPPFSSTPCSPRPGGGRACWGRSRPASTASGGPATRTTPEAIDLQRLFREMLDAGDRSCAMEATSHGSALRRLDRVRFSVLVFTNLDRDHLDFHRDMEDYFDAKRRLFLGDDAPPAAVNVGDAYGRRLADELRERDAAPHLRPHRRRRDPARQRST